MYCYDEMASCPNDAAPFIVNGKPLFARLIIPPFSPDTTFPRPPTVLAQDGVGLVLVQEVVV
jgi:hypothetical protein